MNCLKTLIFIFGFGAFVFGCGEGSRYPVEKRFWTAEDYSDVVFEIGYKIPEGQPYPRFSDPETSLVIRKLVDPANYEVILDDTELGLNYKSEVSQVFFDEYRELFKLYTAMDIQDKYVYPEELIEIAAFGLGFQIKYFSLGNTKIIEQAVDPKASRVRDIIRSNEQAIISNFTNYLDHFNEEKYFGSFAPSLADGVKIHFRKLIETFPNGNYDAMLKAARLMLNKSEVAENKTALTELINKLEAMKKPA